MSLAARILARRIQVWIPFLIGAVTVQHADHVVVRVLRVLPVGAHLGVIRAATQRPAEAKDNKRRHQSKKDDVEKLHVSAHFVRNIVVRTV